MQSLIIKQIEKEKDDPDSVFTFKSISNHRKVLQLELFKGTNFESKLQETKKKQEHST